MLRHPKQNDMDKFYEDLQYKQQFRPYTIEGYKRVLNKVFRDLDTLKVKPKQAESWMLNMQKKKYSASHINNTANILERYIKFKGKKIKLIRVKKPKPSIKDTLTEGEVARILAAAKNNREKAMIAILAYSGVRANELCNLKVQDIDLDNGILKVIDGKGGKDGVCYISRECCKMINEYLKEYETNPHLFKTLQRKARYTTWALRKMVKKVAKKAGISKRVYPHLFRHSLASNLIKKGANIITVQNQLRHEKIDTTMVYIRSFPERIKDEYQYFVPNYI